MADQKMDKMTGRVYRVAPKGSKTKAPKLNLTSAASCVQALKSPNQATRYLAWTALHEMQGRAEGALEKLWKNKDPRLRARSLHLLARINGKEKKYVDAAIKDTDADIRITGLRIARELKLDLIPKIQSLAQD